MSTPNRRPVRPDVIVDTPFDRPPRWAELQRRLIDRMNAAIDPVLDRYVRDDGAILWPVRPDQYGIDALDDAYESFHNWPLFYLVGGDRRFLDAAHREFDAINSQFARYPTGKGYPMCVDEYQPAYDWFHQGEGNLLFYLLATADPEHPAARERAERFARYFTGDDPRTPNYDPDLRLLRCAHVGSVGPAFWNFTRHEDFPAAGWGLPFHDIEGVRDAEDLDHPARLRRARRVAAERRGRGDTPNNLSATSLAALAFALGGGEEFRRWVQEYVEAWIDRTEANGGVLPDNVGIDGVIGSHTGGRWYGGNYGWTHPHGWQSLGAAVCIAAQNATLLTADRRWLDLPRQQLNHLVGRGVEREGKLYVPHRYGDPGRVHYRAFPFLPMLRNDDQIKTPQHRADWRNAATALQFDGWFDFEPMHARWFTFLWACSMSESDRARPLELTHNPAPGVDLDPTIDGWRHLKDQGSTCAGWLRFLRGELPDYPEAVLNRNLEQCAARLELIANDDEDPATYGDAYLQKRNPITMEGLVQLTMGGPLPVYNGGLLHVRLRYVDPQRSRPGLPPDVAALVRELHEDRTVVELCNLGDTPRDLLLHGGAFGEHRLTEARWTDARGTRRAEATTSVLAVRLAPHACARLEIVTELYANRPRL